MTTSSSQKKAGRKWIRFRLRTSLIFIAILSVWLAWTVNRARQQREASLWVAKSQARVEFAFEFDQDGRRIKDAQLPVPEWVLGFLDIHYFSNVVKVNGVRPSDDDLQPLTKLVHLRMLTIDSDLENEDLTLLSNLQELEMLTFTSPDLITDLGPLSELSRLKYLWLESSQVTDLKPLSGLKSLESLTITGTDLDDLTPLAGLTQLEQLNIKGSRVRDLAPLSGLINLKYLNVAKTDIMDWTPIFGLVNLQRLNLSFTEFEDFSALAALSKLQVLNLFETNVTEAEIEKLKLAIPDCVFAP